MGALLGFWTIIVMVIWLNGFAGGVAAVLHVLWKKQRRRVRALISASVTAAIPLSIMVPAMLADLTGISGFVTGAAVAIPIMFVLAFAASLPGAVLVARLLDRPGESHLAFD